MGEESEKEEKKGAAVAAPAGGAKPAIDLPWLAGKGSGAAANGIGGGGEFLSTALAFLAHPAGKGLAIGLVLSAATYSLTLLAESQAEPLTGDWALMAARVKKGSASDVQWDLRNEGLTGVIPGLYEVTKGSKYDSLALVAGDRGESPRADPGGEGPDPGGDAPSAEQASAGSGMEGAADMSEQELFDKILADKIAELEKDPDAKKNKKLSDKDQSALSGASGGRVSGASGALRKFDLPLEAKGSEGGARGRAQGRKREALASLAGRRIQPGGARGAVDQLRRAQRLSRQGSKAGAESGAREYSADAFGAGSSIEGAGLGIGGAGAAAAGGAGIGQGGGGGGGGVKTGESAPPGDLLGGGGGAPNLTEGTDLKAPPDPGDEADKTPYQEMLDEADQLAEEGRGERKKGILMIAAGAALVALGVAWLAKGWLFGAAMALTLIAAGAALIMSGIEKVKRGTELGVKAEILGEAIRQGYGQEVQGLIVIEKAHEAQGKKGSGGKDPAKCGFKEKMSSSELAAYTRCMGQ